MTMMILMMMLLKQRKSSMKKTLHLLHPLPLMRLQLEQLSLRACHSIHGQNLSPLINFTVIFYFILKSMTREGPFILSQPFGTLF